MYSSLCEECPFSQSFSSVSRWKEPFYYKNDVRHSIAVKACHRWSWKHCFVSEKMTEHVIKMRYPASLQMTKHQNNCIHNTMRMNKKLHGFALAFSENTTWTVNENKNNNYVEIDSFFFSSIQRNMTYIEELCAFNSKAIFMELRICSLTLRLCCCLWVGDVFIVHTWQDFITMLDYYYQFLYRTTLYMHIDVQPFTLTISYLYSEAFFSAIFLGFLVSL